LGQDIRSMKHLDVKRPPLWRREVQLNQVQCEERGGGPARLCSMQMRCGRRGTFLVRGLGRGLLWEARGFNARGFFSWAWGLRAGLAAIAEVLGPRAGLSGGGGPWEPGRCCGCVMFGACECPALPEPKMSLAAAVPQPRWSNSPCLGGSEGERVSSLIVRICTIRLQLSGANVASHHSIEQVQHSLRMNFVAVQADLWDLFKNVAPGEGGEGSAQPSYREGTMTEGKSQLAQRDMRHGRRWKPAREAPCKIAHQNSDKTRSC
jgi:hypothetical protein